MSDCYKVTSGGEQKRYAVHGTAGPSSSSDQADESVSAAAKLLEETGCRVEAVSWLDGRTGAARPWQEILAELAAVEGAVDIVFASGLTDPGASAGDLMLANVERPIGLIGATIDQKQLRYLTIGSVLETFLEPCDEQSLPRLQGRALGAHRGACGRSAP